MNRTRAWLFAAAASLPALAAAESTPTFHRDIAPIFQKHCQECHRAAGTNYGGMVAPMALVSYEETRPWAKSIAQQVKAREMPPWDADPRFHGVFSNERILSDKEIATIEKWAALGAPPGDAKDAPPPREFPVSGGWMIGEPDLVVTIPTAYTVGDDVGDQYTGFAVDLTEAMLPEDKYVAAFQCKPGVKIIHHFNAHLLPPKDGKLPPPPDKFESETISPKNAGFYIGGVSSGSEANIYPDGYGLTLQKGSRVTFDIHYHKPAGPGTAVTDSTSQIGFKFCKEPPKAKIDGLSIMNFNIRISPGEANYRMGPFAQKILKDTTLVALMPHMHMRGKGAKFEAFYPDGKSEVLLEVPTYDFNWQTVYYFKEMKSLPKGTRVEYTSWYDNSPEYGALRGFDSTQPVRYGQKSTDEMMMGFLMAAPVPGAE